MEAWENSLRAAVLSAGAKALASLLDGVGCGRQDEAIVCNCGARMESHGLKSKPLLTILGPVDYKRSLFQCPACNQTRYPGDEQLPKRRVKDARVGGVHGEIGSAGGLADIEDVIPSRAAISRAVDAALFSRSSVRRTLHRNVDAVGIRWMDPDARDRARARKAHMGPRAASIRRFVDAVSVRRHHAADGVLTHAHINHVGIGISDSDGADGGRVQETVGDVRPRNAAIGRFPNAAADTPK